MDVKTVGKVIKQYREKKNWSQEVLSGLAGVNRSHLSKIEIGKNSPTITILHRIADALGIKTSELIKTVESEIEKEQG